MVDKCLDRMIVMWVHEVESRLNDDKRECKDLTVKNVKLKYIKHVLTRYCFKYVKHVVK